MSFRLSVLYLLPNLFIVRFKLKFSPDKVDTMVVQAIALLDDLDKEINIYSMRVKVRSDLNQQFRTLDVVI